MATAPTKKTPARGTTAVREHLFVWEGKDKTGKIIRGEMRATTETVVQTILRRQGILTLKIRKQTFARGRKITDKDIALFTRQLATMMKAGVPLLQTFDIVGRGHDNPAVGKLLLDIKSDVETGSSLSQAFRKFPLYFDQLLQPDRRRRTGGHSGDIARATGDVQGKNDRHQVEDQVGLVLPDRHHHRGLHHHRSDHDFRHPCFQGSFHEFWCRPSGTDPVGDGYFRLFCSVLVAHFWRYRRRNFRLLLRLEALGKTTVHHGPAASPNSGFW